MKFYLVFILFIVCCLFSCKTEEPPVATDNMSNLLADLHMAESFGQLIPKDKGGYMTKDQDTVNLIRSHILKKYGMDTLSFKQALAWYKERPKEFDAVYEKVLETLSIRKESKLDSVIEYSDTTSRNTQDSLQD
jgi:hypothetical protein